MNDMHVLITGGAGYIGSHTAKVLAGAGLKPVVVDNLQRGYRHNVQWGPLVEADIADRKSLRQVFRQYPIEAVIHFAAFAYVGESMQAPELYFGNNVVKTLDVLDVMREEDRLLLQLRNLRVSISDPHIRGARTATCKPVR
jgi:UDP-arabinose 4-epimerase